MHGSSRKELEVVKVKDGVYICLREVFDVRFSKLIQTLVIIRICPIHIS